MKKIHTSRIMSLRQKAWARDPKKRKTKQKHKKQLGTCGDNVFEQQTIKKNNAKRVKTDRKRQKRRKFEILCFCEIVEKHEKITLKGL